jgi:hypothetical protein
MVPPGANALLVSENPATANLPCADDAFGSSMAFRMTVQPRACRAPGSRQLSWSPLSAGICFGLSYSDAEERLT